MDPLTAAAATGLQARMDSFDMLANNLANGSSNGFKADREFYSTYLSSELAGATDPTVGEAPVIERRWTDFTQGTLLQTGNPTDLALSGNGFFSVNGPNGPLFTRNGTFHISPKGVLVSAEGYPVRLTGNQTLNVQPFDKLEIAVDGQVLQNGAPVGQLELVDFGDASKLVKMGATYFQDPGIQAGARTAAAEVYQGKAESSNAVPAEAAAKMVGLLRHFEMLQHAIKIGADMNRQAVTEVARVGS